LRPIPRYFQGVLLHAPFADVLARAPRFRSLYDIEAWKAAGYVRALAEFRRAAPAEIATSIEPRVRDMIESRIRTFGEHPAGLGRFTRTMFARDLRRRIEVNAS
jgi:hypothetical protein